MKFEVSVTQKGKFEDTIKATFSNFEDMETFINLLEMTDESESLAINIKIIKIKE